MMKLLEGQYIFYGFPVFIFPISADNDEPCKTL